ncbi:MAG: hypothetical protein WA364_24095 [Candidatus Nitrosopolaris sp.]
MNTKSTMVFSTITIVAVVALFASGPIVMNQQAFGQWHGGWDGHHKHW